MKTPQPGDKLSLLAICYSHHRSMSQGVCLPETIDNKPLYTVSFVSGADFYIQGHHYDVTDIYRIYPKETHPEYYI